MAEIKGTNVASPVVPFTTEDIYATHEAKYGKGGFRSVSNLTELHSIPTLRLEEGMVVYVLDDPSGIHNYQYLGGNWVRSRTSQGIPVYTQELIDELGINPPKDSYVSIPSSTDINGEVEHNTFTTTENGTYIDILFKALRALQSEVAKLKNSFEYGIESYTGTTTAMSSITHELKTEEEEPLWAIMEGNLSEITEIPLAKGHPFIPEENVEVIIDPNTLYTYLKFNNEGKYNFNNDVRNSTDSKLFLYLTTKNKDIKIDVDVFGSDTFPINPDLYHKVIDFNKIVIKETPLSLCYNILVVISRKQQMSDGEFYGNNFIWISISDPDTNKVLTEGYWKDNKIYDNVIAFDDEARYCFDTIYLKNLTLSKFKIYSKWQDFSHEVIPSQPSEQDYKFKAAHITIRSVDKQETLESVKNQILNNELIFVEDTKRLWIKSNNKLTIVAGGGGSESGGGDTGMDKAELIKYLQEIGIVQESNGDLKVSNLAIEDIIFIHQATGKRFKFSIDSEGNIKNQELVDPSTKFGNIIKNNNYKLVEDIRGFIGNLNGIMDFKSRDADFGLKSDRLKIGSFYAPFESDIVHGCSHSYIELENTSDKDINLEGCYLHCTRPDHTLLQVVYHLPLTGVIPAGGTYLIRGKQHANFDDTNVYLKVKTFDQEWFIKTSEGVKELISFEILENNTLAGDRSKGFGFALTYGNNFGGTEENPVALTETYPLVKKSVNGKTYGIGSSGSIGTIKIDDSNIKTFPYACDPYFIDGIYYNQMVMDSSDVGFWAPSAIILKHNSIYRNTFELDPAKQAFQSFNKKDSSRTRWQSGKDIQIVSLDKELISFPHTEDTYPISNYTPKSSKDHRNVCSDKTKLNPNRPNMVTSSFGTDIYKTRCFNWISIGYFPEYIWIKKENDLSWGKGISSYLPILDIQFTSITEKTEIVSGKNISTTTLIFKVLTKDFQSSNKIKNYNVLTDENHLKLYNKLTYKILDQENSYEITLPGLCKSQFSIDKIYHLYQSMDYFNDDLNITYPRKKTFSSEITNNIYARLVGRFPADRSLYTAHKVIVDIVNKNVVSPTKYKYIVGRADKNGNPDPLHTSEEMSFTLYPDTYKPRIYQITDQQGFNWIEYQVWAAVAEKLNDKIKKDQEKSNIIPILINTGDMTQNGTRINEWYDYYQAGRHLFDHLEQMNVVGNNDLCGPDPEVLGTGDDNGKSNSFYFHVFYCYEVGGKLSNGTIFSPLVSPTSTTSISKYIPSLYYFDAKGYRYIMANSEITETCCKTWFKLFKSIEGEEVAINIYTGYVIKSGINSYVSGFTTIYTMLWRILKDAKDKNLKVITVCHEMPFTVITSDSLSKDALGKSRSISNADKLVGSHMNMISTKEVSELKSSKGIYWFSRLMEYYGVKLVLGGHKHTYTCTYPVRENYEYESPEGSIIKSDTKIMEMKETLESDTINFLDKSSGTTKDTSKLPFIKRADIGTAAGGIFYPCICKPNLTGGVVYFMCQASGYKLTSNKELPSNDQKFSRILPETSGKEADNNQKVPMFAIIDDVNGKFTIRLARVNHIFKDYKFDQYNYDTTSMSFDWLTETDVNNYGKWVPSEEEIELFKVE